MSQKKKTVDEYLSEVDYHPDPNYKPTTFALDFVNFIKLVNGADGEENKTPVFHLKMLDSLTQEGDISVNMGFYILLYMVFILVLRVVSQQM